MPLSSESRSMKHKEVYTEPKSTTVHTRLWNRKPMLTCDEGGA